MKKEDNRISEREEQTVDFSKNKSSPVLFLLLVIMAVIVFLFFAGSREKTAEVKTAVLETEADLVSVSRKEEIVQSELSKDQTDTMESEEKKEEWKQLLFGETTKRGIIPKLTVSGWTTSEKKEFAFQETDFLYQAAEFLSDQDIRTEMIEIEEELPSSSPGMKAYYASMKNVKDKALLILVYLDFDGFYSFILLNTKEETSETTMQIQSQTEAADRIVMDEKPKSEETVETVQTERSYDASRLNIKALPKTLLNYIDNPYELKYGLYDYLYNNGHREEMDVTCQSYSIDPDTREAAMQFMLANGTTVHGIYKKNENLYSFYE